MEFTHKRLEKLCDIIIGRTPSRSNKAYWGKSNTWVSITDLKTKLITKTKEQITNLGVDKSRSRLITKGTLLLSFKLSIGKLAFAGKDLYTNEAIAALPILDRNEIDKDYLYYALKYIPLVGGNQAAMGKTLNKKSLSELLIPYPKSISDQKRIAKILSDCEQLIDWRKESIQLLDKYLEATFLEMFGDREKFKLDTIKNIASKKKYSLSSGPFGSSLTSKDYVKDGVLVLRGKNIANGILDLSDSKFVINEKAESLKRSAIFPNDIVIVAVGSSGVAFKIPDEFPKAIVSQNFNKVTCNTDKVLPTFLQHMINSEIVQSKFRKVMVDAGRSFLSLTNIKNVEIPIPDLNSQYEFEDIVSKVQSVKNDFSKSLDELNSLFGSISQKAFKDELDLSKVEIVSNRVISKGADSIYIENISGDFNINKAENVKASESHDNVENIEYKILNQNVSHLTFGNLKPKKENIDKINIEKIFFNNEGLNNLVNDIKGKAFLHSYFEYTFAGKPFTFNDLLLKFENVAWLHDKRFVEGKLKNAIYNLIEDSQPIIEQFLDENDGKMKLKLTDEAPKA